MVKASWIRIFVGWAVIVGGTVAMLGGCTAMTAPDSNAHVFQTVGETESTRRAQQEREWKELAVTMLRQQRPNVAVRAAEEFAVILEGKGMRRVIDLSELREPLSAQSEWSEAILRDYLTQQLPEFDQAWLASESFEQMRAYLRAWPIGREGLNEINRQLGEDGPMHATLVAGELYWIPAVRLEGAGAAIPVGPRVLKEWGVETEEIDRIALENTRTGLKGEVFETIRFGPAGQVGRLKPGVDPGVVLLPEFLEKVRKTWESEDDLALLLTSGEVIQFVESGNKQLLDLMYPRWREMMQEAAAPLSRRPLLLTSQGVAEMDYDPPAAVRHLATQPTSRPVGFPRLPTTRPTTRGYIVR